MLFPGGPEHSDLPLDVLSSYCGEFFPSDYHARHKLLKFVFYGQQFFVRILKIARTIADLVGAERLEAAHLAEAIQYRSLERQWWG